MEKREKASKSIIIIFLLLFIFTLFQFLSPLILPSNSIDIQSGTVGVIDNQGEIRTLPFPHDMLYSAGDRLCHQKQERSLFINGNQMPFCSRCTAIWIGFTIGIGLMMFYKVPLNNRFLILAIISLIPIGIDGTGQLLGFWESSHLSRVITGGFIGTICGVAIGLIIDEVKILKKSKTS